MAVVTSCVNRRRSLDPHKRVALTAHHTVLRLLRHPRLPFPLTCDCLVSWAGVCGGPCMCSCIAC
jgi:hypothetical protein